jgi:hypothetical protein
VVEQVLVYHQILLRLLVQMAMVQVPMQKQALLHH